MPKKPWKRINVEFHTFSHWDLPCKTQVGLTTDDLGIAKSSAFHNIWFYRHYFTYGVGPVPQLEILSHSYYICLDFMKNKGQLHFLSERICGNSCRTDLSCDQLHYIIAQKFCVSSEPHTIYMISCKNLSK